MAEQNWTMRGEYMESCNCDYLCPCIYTNPQGPATHDHCTAAMVFRIDEGNCGDTKLGGLKFALVIRSGRVMADGNWVFAGVVDESADTAQRQALAAIVSGEAGGPPSFIRQHLVSDFRGVEFKPIEFGISGLRRSVAIPLSRSRGSPRAIGPPSRSISTILLIRRAGVWHWRARKKPTCTALVSSWTSPARVTTAISPPSPGPPSR
jgi:hypothetical protein